jgi:hypothetical protein
MFRQMAQDNFVLYLMLMSLMGATLGFVGTLLLAVIIYWHRVTIFLYDMFSLGWT